jgi:mannose-6-phosphate isomerase-like protein (cupin superfamily)
MTDPADGVDPVARTTRPWGSFDQFVTNHACTVTIVTVGAGQQLPWQRHGGRDEMWHVLEGRLGVDRGLESLTVGPGEPVAIPRGTSHRVSTTTPSAVRILQIAVGDLEDVEEPTRVP